MKIIHILLFLLTIGFVGISCKKTTSNSSTSSLVGKLKTLTEEVVTNNYYSNATYNFNYDTSGRIISMTKSNGAGFYYQYSGNNFFSMNILDSTQIMQ